MLKKMRSMNITAPKLRGDLHSTVKKVRKIACHFHKSGVSDDKLQG